MGYRAGPKLRLGFLGSHKLQLSPNQAAGPILGGPTNPKLTQHILTMNQDYTDKQLSLCKRFGVDCLSSADFQKVGVSGNILDQSWSWPVHGLRHQPHSEATGWYIWSGEFTEAADFFSLFMSRI